MRAGSRAAFPTLVLLGFIVLAPGTLHASSFMVDTEADLVDAMPGDGICATVFGTCSLRAAIQEANRQPGPQGITLPPGTYDLVTPPDDEDDFDDAVGDLDLLDDVNIVGADRHTAIVSGNDISRIFDVPPGVAAAIRKITVRLGNDSGGGGVRATSASLALDNVIIEGNESSGDGGGVQVLGSESVLVVRDSTIRTNLARFLGGGIAVEGRQGRVTIVGSRIMRNLAGSGGGLYAQMVDTVNVSESTVGENIASGGGRLSRGGGIRATNLSLVQSTVWFNSADGRGGGVFADGDIVNSTISHNMSGVRGGGVSASGTLFLLHTTIAENEAAFGGNGLDQFAPRMPLFRNSILANPGGTECSGIVSSLGNNILTDMSCGRRANGDKQLPDALDRLRPLCDYGGPTRTYLPRSGSPAINAAAPTGSPVDQRGRPRPRRADIGSVERQPVEPAESACRPQG